jgi:hypothetical protein
MNRNEIEHIIREAISGQPSPEELEAVARQVERQQELAAVVRDLQLEEEEPSLPPSLEERP